MKESKLRLEDALAATKAGVEEGIIFGGGSAYIHASKKVAKMAEELEGDERQVQILSSKLSRLHYSTLLQTQDWKVLLSSIKLKNRKLDSDSTH